MPGVIKSLFSLLVCFLRLLTSFVFSSPLKPLISLFCCKQTKSREVRKKGKKGGSEEKKDLKGRKTFLVGWEIIKTLKCSTATTWSNTAASIPVSEGINLFYTSISEKTSILFLIIFLQQAYFQSAPCYVNVLVVSHGTFLRGSYDPVTFP